MTDELIPIIERVTEAIASDDEDTADQNERIVAAYRRATPEQRAVLDEVFVALCGWSLTTLIHDHGRTSW